MCGTDYNKNIFKVGSETAYKHILNYNNIDNIKDNTTLDISVLNHIRGRQLFRDYEQTNIEVSYCGSPDFEKLNEFVIKHKMLTDLSKLKKDFINIILVFE